MILTTCIPFAPKYYIFNAKSVGSRVTDFFKESKSKTFFFFFFLGGGGGWGGERLELVNFSY